MVVVVDGTLHRMVTVSQFLVSLVSEKRTVDAVFISIRFQEE